MTLLAVLLLLAGGVAWFAVTLSSGPDFERLPPHHLFKSERAEAEYFAQYDRLASRWPVPSETRFVDHSDLMTSAYHTSVVPIIR